MKTKFTSDEINPICAYQLGRVDALLGDPPTRFSAQPWPGRLPVPEAHFGCTKTEADNIDAIRVRYREGYDSQLSQISAPATKI